MTQKAVEATLLRVIKQSNGGYHADEAVSKVRESGASTEIAEKALWRLLDQRKLRLGKKLRIELG